MIREGGTDGGEEIGGSPRAFERAEKERDLLRLLRGEAFDEVSREVQQPGR